ncbi:MAG: threonine synthase [Flavobacteriaceae bacterium]|nr:threonine synthase [Flavobacteriaceae bacterium]
MKFYSLNNRKHTVSFKEAVINGIAPDKGLYFPEKITRLRNYVLNNLDDMTNYEVAFESMKQFSEGAITDQDLNKIIQEVIDFDFPVIALNEKTYCLELFHGPTLAFKDVGARFMARCLKHFTDKKVTVLVATSGDTGSAVASAFHNIKDVNVVILYPKGKVSSLQEKQLTTFDNNIQALEYDGTFDECQTIVKNAFLDDEILNYRNLTSANSINIARWLPQMWYYFFAYKQLKATDQERIAVSVPSGNFGNICAGLLAKELGLPVHKFIAACNQNNIVYRYLTHNDNTVRETIPTLSNAMDVGDPSNFIRILELFNQDKSELKNNLLCCYYLDVQTREAIKDVYNTYEYIVDPHGAIGYLGLKDCMEQYGLEKGVFLETAHPIKFPEVVNQCLNIDLATPERVQSVLHKDKNVIAVSCYSEVKEFLLSNNI